MDVDSKETTAKDNWTKLDGEGLGALEVSFAAEENKDKFLVRVHHPALAASSSKSTTAVPKKEPSSPSLALTSLSSLPAPSPSSPSEFPNPMFGGESLDLGMDMNFHSGMNMNFDGMMDPMSNSFDMGFNSMGMGFSGFGMGLNDALVAGLPEFASSTEKPSQAPAAAEKDVSRRCVRIALKSLEENDKTGLSTGVWEVVVV